MNSDNVKRRDQVRRRTRNGRYKCQRAVAFNFTVGFLSGYIFGGRGRRGLFVGTVIGVITTITTLLGGCK